MKTIDYSLPGGFPLDTDVLAVHQEQSNLAAKSALLGGFQYILEGCIKVGNNISNGTVVINGELLPFIGGAEQATVIISVTPETLTYEDGAKHPAILNRVAMFGNDGVTNIQWADFKRSDPSNGVLARLDKMERMLKPLLGYDSPTDPGVKVYGSWLFWGRPAAEIPAGWEPVPDVDWKGKFPVVLDEAQAHFSTVGKSGGSIEHTVTKNNIQEFTISRPGSSGTGGVGNPVAGNGTDDGSVDYKVGVQQPTGINHLPPFKVVMFIRFAG